MSNLTGKMLIPTCDDRPTQNLDAVQPAQSQTPTNPHKISSFKIKRGNLLYKQEGNLVKKIFNL